MLSLLLGLYTAHMTGGTYNNENQLMAAKYNSYVAGTMVNSYKRRSYLAGYDIEGGENWGIIVGGVSGYDYDCMRKVCMQYERDQSDVIPLIAPYYRYGPLVGVAQGGAFTLILEIEL